MVHRYAVRRKMEGKVGIHRPYAIVVPRRWTFLRHRFDHRRNRHVTTGRSSPVPAADVAGIAANVVLIVFRPSPCGTNSDWPETRSPLSSPPSWPPLPARPTCTLPDADWPPTTAVTAIASWLLGRILADRRRQPSWQLRRATICRSWPSAGLEVPPIAGTCSAFHQRLRATFGLDSGHYHPPLLPPTCSSPPTPLSLTFTVVCRSTIANFLSGQPLVFGCELLGPARHSHDLTDPFDRFNLFGLNQTVFLHRFWLFMDGSRYIFWSWFPTYKHITDIVATCSYIFFICSLVYRID